MSSFLKIKSFAKCATRTKEEKYKKIGNKPRLKTTEAHSKASKDYVLRNLENNYCRYCKRSRINSYVCLQHYIKDMSRRSTVLRVNKNKIGGWKMALKGDALNKLTSELITKLEDQNYKCYYSNIPLVIGENLSLDHIYPSSLHPELLTESSNMVFVDKRINNLKSNMSPKDFYNFMLQLKEGIAYLENNEDFKKYLED